MKSIRAVRMTWSLLLLLVAAFVIAESQAFEKFGCTYYNENMSDYQGSTDSVFKAKYSEKKVEPMKFESFDKFSKMVYFIQRIFYKVLRESVADDLHEFIDFYYSRKKYNGSFEDFYKEMECTFNVKKSPGTSLSLSYTLLYELEREYGIGNHCHLVTAARFAVRAETSHMLEDLKSQKHNLLNDPPGEDSLFTHNHVASVIHVEVEGKRGVVLLDITRFKTCSIEGPIVLMKRGNMCGSLTHVERFKEFYPFKLFDVGQYIVKEYQFYSKYNYMNVMDGDTFYYIGKPYCSARISTFKRQLLMNSVRTVEYETMRSFLEFDVFHKSLRECISGGQYNNKDIEYNNKHNIIMSTLTPEKGVIRKLLEKCCILPKSDENHQINAFENQDSNSIPQYNYYTKNSDFLIDLKAVRIQVETVANDEEFAKEFNKWKEYMEGVSNGTQENVHGF